MQLPSSHWNCVLEQRDAAKYTAPDVEHNNKWELRRVNTSAHLGWWRGIVVGVIQHMNEVTRHWAWLVLG